MGDVENIINIAKSLIASRDQALALHGQFHTDDFDVIKIKKSASFDIPPWSLFYGASDIGSWDGLLSIDGKKIVITKGGYFKEGKITASWVLERDDIEFIKIGAFKTKIVLRRAVKGLTTPSVFESALLVLCGVIPYFLYDKRKVRIRFSNEFKNATIINGKLEELMS